MKTQHVLDLVCMATLITGCVDEAMAPGLLEVNAPQGQHSVTVMTRNLYLGADLDHLMTMSDPNQVPIAIAQAWAEINATNFPARAGRLAAEIARTDPQLIGLQEATEYRIQSPSDFVLGVVQPNATTMAIDFVAILLDSLAARGLAYREVARVRNEDVEFPAYTGQGPSDPGTLAQPFVFTDIRYTDYDVILARSDVTSLRTWGRNFAAKAPISVTGLPLDWPAGWTAVEAVVNNDTIVFANTHLEIQNFTPINEAQAAELVAWLAQFDRTVVVVGDFNSAANPGAPTDKKTASYGAFLTAGFVDVWARGHDLDAGLTCCHDPGLHNTVPRFSQRLDLILVRQQTDVFAGSAQVAVVGTDPANRTATGLWPSDHAGLVATVRLAAGVPF